MSLAQTPLRPAAEAPLQAAIRAALHAGQGRVAVRLGAPPPHQARLLRGLLLEGALACGGQVVEGPDGDLLLVGAEAARGARLAAMLEKLLSASTMVYSLDRDMPALRSYAAGELAGGAPDLPGLDDWLAEVPLLPLVARTTGTRPPPDAGPAVPAFLRVTIARAALARRLGALSADGDLLQHAAGRLAERLLLAMADPAQAQALFGQRPPGAALHLALPPAALTDLVPGGSGGARANRNRLVASCDAADLAAPEALITRRAALAARGWALELTGFDALLLPLLAPERLPADLLRVTWSPALSGPAARAALARVDPGAILLAGVDCAAALDCARGLGVAAIEGSIADAAFAATRA